LILKRPVSTAVPLYHGYGNIQDSPVNFMGFHSGYDYGFNNCNPIGEPIIAMGVGVVDQTWVDEPHPSSGGKNGGLRISYGLRMLSDGRMERVYAIYGHVVPIVGAGTKVNTDMHIANFSTCERYGYTPELEIQIMIEESNGNLAPINPILVGILPR